MSTWLTYFHRACAARPPRMRQIKRRRAPMTMRCSGMSRRYSSLIATSPAIRTASWTRSDLAAPTTGCCISSTAIRGCGLPAARYPANHQAKSGAGPARVDKRRLCRPGGWRRGQARTPALCQPEGRGPGDAACGAAIERIRTALAGLPAEDGAAVARLSGRHAGAGNPRGAYAAAGRRGHGVQSAMGGQ